MKIIQVVATINKYSDGVNHAVRGMSRGLASCGVRVELHCLNDVPEVLKTAPSQVVNAKRERFPIASIGRSPEMEAALQRSVQDADIIHSNGLWMMPNIYPEWAIRGTKCKLVVQPHGTLSRWAMKRSWWKKMHIASAEREAQDTIALFASPERLTHPSVTDQKKMKYYKLPPYVRAVMYWGIRYFLWKGFLDGRAGWQWNF